ncbi:MAG: rhomboid family intramembrane serine protease [Alphaproteobacteria bacterium]|nr:rhomboid family intramembrane serine protease [Alphaproteobacteria bacterium]
MFIPVRDENPLKTIPFQYVTVLLIAINVAVFAFTYSGVDPYLISSFAVRPSELFLVNVIGGASPVTNDAVAVPEAYTLISYMFFHGDIWHLLGNMVFLWVFGDNVEDAVGHIKFLVFYLACGVFAALLHAFLVSGTEMAGVPLIGASGAVAGVIAAYLMLHPRVRVWVLALKFIPLQVSAAIVLGLWVITQVVMVLSPQIGDPNPVAWWAHIGGLLAGAVLIIVFRRPGIPLFDRALG